MEKSTFKFRWGRYTHSCLLHSAWKAPCQMEGKEIYEHTVTFKASSREEADVYSSKFGRTDGILEEV